VVSRVVGRKLRSELECLNEERRGSGNFSGISETTSTASDDGMGGKLDGAVPTLDFSDEGLPFLRSDRLTVCFALSTLPSQHINQPIVSSARFNELVNYWLLGLYSSLDKKTIFHFPQWQLHKMTE